jgi:hypothetical protein
VSCFVGQISRPLFLTRNSPASLPDGSGCCIRIIRMRVLGLQASHLLLIRTNLGYGTVLTAACARQGCSATDYCYYIILKLYLHFSTSPCLQRISPILSSPDLVTKLTTYVQVHKLRTSLSETLLPSLIALSLLRQDILLCTLSSDTPNLRSSLFWDIEFQLISMVFRFLDTGDVKTKVWNSVIVYFSKFDLLLIYLRMWLNVYTLLHFTCIYFLPL